jgi:hypothetical protein
MAQTLAAHIPHACIEDDNPTTHPPGMAAINRNEHARTLEARQQ